MRPSPGASTIGSGDLPDGLSLSSTGRHIRFTHDGGTFHLTVKATNTEDSDTRDLSIAIPRAVCPA
jgi:hypothetical protein